MNPRRLLAIAATAVVAKLALILESYLGVTLSQSDKDTLVALIVAIVVGVIHWLIRRTPTTPRP